MSFKTQYFIKKRLSVLTIPIVFIFCLLSVRLFFVQIVNGEKLSAKALDQWTRDLPLTAKRGDIFDREGRLLASSQTVYNVYVRPNEVKDKRSVAKILASILLLDEEKLFEKINKKVSEITVKTKISKETMLEIKKQINQGVYFSQNILRYYPYPGIMSQLLGFTSGDNLGQTGIEAYYDTYLKGTDGYQLTKTDLVGRALDDNIYYVNSIDGMDVNLTIDYYIQALAENAVASAVEKYLAKSSTCIIMDPNNGEILALAQAPGFDLNNVPRDNVTELFSKMKCYAVSNVYEPGSTFKTVTAAIGLETGAFTPEYAFYCPGYRLIDGQKIKCWKTIGHGSLHYGQGITYSCNCLFMDIATKVGAEKMYDWFGRFGLNVKSGIDVYGEATSLMIKKENVKTVDIARMGFGQAIAITPIELIRAVSAVINGGNLVTPHLLKSIFNGDKTIRNENLPMQTGIISETTSSLMRKYLESVVTDGSGKAAGVNGYSIGGKTGTAQKYENGSIARGKYVSSFIGFTSVDNPKYVCLMIVDEPQGYLYYGSLVAAPYVGEIFKSLFAYENITPENAQEEKYSVMPDVVGLSASAAAALLKKQGITYEVEGSGGKVIYQFPSFEAQINTKTVAFIKLSDE